MIHVSQHACDRFIEHVQPCSHNEAREAILSHHRALQAAIDFQCEIVRLGSGARLVLERNRVVTVYAPGALPRQCRSRYRIGEA